MDDMCRGARVADPDFFAAVHGRAAEIERDLRAKTIFPSEEGYTFLLGLVERLKEESAGICGRDSHRFASTHEFSLVCGEFGRMVGYRMAQLNATIPYLKALHSYPIELIDKREDVRAHDDRMMQEAMLAHAAYIQALCEAAKGKRTPVLQTLAVAA